MIAEGLLTYGVYPLPVFSICDSARLCPTLPDCTDAQHAQQIIGQWIYLCDYCATSCPHSATADVQSHKLQRISKLFDILERFGAFVHTHTDTHRHSQAYALFSGYTQTTSVNHRRLFYSWPTIYAQCAQE